MGVGQAAPLLSVALTIRRGGTAIIMEHFDPEQFLALVERHRATHSVLVPTMFSRMLKLPDAVRRRYDELMVRAAASPGATLGQRLYAARRRVNVSAAETAAALGAPAELVEGLEAGNAVDPSTAARVRPSTAAQF